MDDDLPGPVGHLRYTTAAFTPNALASIGAANTSTDTTSPTMHARRPNSVSSPPHSMVPPAMAIPIRPIAYATGPVRDVAMVCIGRSQGRLPAAAACSRMLEAQTSTASSRNLESSHERLEITIRFMNLTSRLRIGLNMLDQVLPVGIPGHEQKFPDLAPRRKIRLLIDEDDEIHRFRDERLLGSARRFCDETLQPRQIANGIIGVHGRHPAGMACIPSFQEGVGLRSANFSDDDPCRLQAHAGPQALQHGHVANSAEIEVVRDRALELRSVF